MTDEKKAELLLLRAGQHMFRKNQLIRHSRGRGQKEEIKKKSQVTDMRQSNGNAGTLFWFFAKTPQPNFTHKFCCCYINIVFDRDQTPTSQSQVDYNFLR